MTMNRRPQLTLDTAVPDRIPIAIVIGKTPEGEDDRRIYYLRDTGEYSTRERKRLSSLLQGIVDFERADEDDITADDIRVYEAAMREVMRIVMPDVPGDVVERLSIKEHGRLCAYVLKLFNQGAETPTPPTVEEPTPGGQGPKRLRRLADRLTWGKASPESAVTTGDTPTDG